jgi:PEP-CTERM motif-containing protein
MGFVTAATPGPGYLIFDSNPSNITYMDPTTGITGDQNQADWTQVLQFTPNAGGGYVAGNMELFTVGCSSGLANPNDRSCFPTYSQLVAADGAYMGGSPGGEPYAFLAAPADGGTYDYTCSFSGCNTYNINYITPQLAASPEPSTFAIGALGVLALALWRRKVS